MAATTVGYYYSKLTGRLRWILVPDDDAELATTPAKGGEAQLLVSLSQHQAAKNPSHHQALVNKATGKTPTGDRYALVANGVVVGVMHADPHGCGDPTPPGHALVPHATAVTGFTMAANGALVKPAPAALPHGFVSAPPLALKAA